MKLEERIEKKKGKKRKRLFFRFGILAVLIGAAAFALISNLTKDKEIYAKGDMAPDFKLAQINGSNPADSIQLSKQSGNGVMLNFWATYCKPCEREMPDIQTMYERYHNQGIDIISINLDSTELVVQNFIEKYKLTFPVVRDKDFAVRELYGINPIPSSIFIDSNGVIVDKKNGELKADEIEKLLKEIKPK